MVENLDSYARTVLAICFGQSYPQLIPQFIPRCSICEIPLDMKEQIVNKDANPV